MIAQVMKGWMKCLILYDQSLEQTLRILLHWRVNSFFDNLRASEESLHEHTIVSVITFVTCLMAIKSKFAFSINCYNELLNLISDVLPMDHKMLKDMYQ
jgi:hypothetical protein